MTSLISPAGARVGGAGRRSGSQTTRSAGGPARTVARRAGIDRLSLPGQPPVATLPAAGGRGD